MLATFATPESSQTILKSATGHPVTVNISSRNWRRVVLLVNDEDHAKITRHLDGVITVTDLMTGIEHRLKGADCGAGCRCAVTFA